VLYMGDSLIVRMTSSDVADVPWIERGMYGGPGRFLHSVLPMADGCQVKVIPPCPAVTVFA